jgi:UDP-glucose 4-epimerase
MTLRTNAPEVVKSKMPDYEKLYAAQNWKMFPGIERVYVNTRARDALGWKPKYDFQYVLDSLQAGIDPRSSLARSVGMKGYHEHTFAHGPYPVVD